MSMHSWFLHFLMGWLCRRNLLDMLEECELLLTLALGVDSLEFGIHLGVCDFSDTSVLLVFEQGWFGSVMLTDHCSWHPFASMLQCNLVTIVEGWKLFSTVFVWVNFLLQFFFFKVFLDFLAPVGFNPFTTLTQKTRIPFQLLERTKLLFWDFDH